MNLIVAVEKNWGIGKDGGLLCHLSGDLKYFKETTMGHPVIMGRKTLESLPGKKGLPGRRNIVLTTREDFEPEGAEAVHSIEELMEALAEGEGGEEGGPEERAVPFVMGGAEVYRELLPFCSTLYVTKIEKEFPSDRFFEDLSASSYFKLAWEGELMEENGIPYRFTRYERVTPDSLRHQGSGSCPAFYCNLRK